MLNFYSCISRPLTNKKGGGQCAVQLISSVFTLTNQGPWQEDSGWEARHRDTEQQLRLELARKKLDLAELAQQAERHAARAQALQARCDRLELLLAHAHVPAAGAQQLLDAAHGTALQQSAQAQSAAQVILLSLCRRKGLPLHDEA